MGPVAVLWTAFDLRSDSVNGSQEVIPGAGRKANHRQARRRHSPVLQSEHAVWLHPVRPINQLELGGGLWS